MLRRRIQLGLIHAAVTMTLVPINSTLNRVMIKELALSATLVAVLASLPYLFSPIQVAIGTFSDRFPVLGLRRTPYILVGFVLCVIGVIVLPRVAFQVGTDGGAGLTLSILAFGAWGMGFNLASVSYFALASEISGEDGRSRTIATMFFMMILTIIITSVFLSRLLTPYSPEALFRAFTIVGLIALGLGLIGILGVEGRSTANESQAASDNLPWSQILQGLTQNRQAMLFFWYLILLLTAILGQDILLEPFGAEAFGLPVNATTRLTSIWGGFFLIALITGGALESRIPKLTIAKLGAWSAVAAFGLIIVSGVQGNLETFYSGVILLGLATGFSTVSNLSLMLDMTIPGSVGLFMGAWGMASAVARLVGNVLSGVIRDLVTQLAQNPIAGYLVVFSVEIAMLLISLWLLRSVDVGLFRKQAVDNPSLVERAALAGDVT
jgi:BCD family chlorophyll transporter-like MFS transporter